MLIKTKDSKNRDIAELRFLLKENITDHQRFLVERELYSLRAGMKNEADSAYFIDFYYGHSKNWAVVHDLRLEHNDQVAQIDHLLINRVFQFFVLESKSYAYGIKINGVGEFEAIYRNKHYGIPSPIEQNKRHIAVLEALIRDEGLLPKRVGVRLQPSFKNFVLISPKSVIIRPDRDLIDTGSVIKADSLKTVVDKELQAMNPVQLAKISSSDTLKRIAELLVSCHTPATTNYPKKFGMGRLFDSETKIQTREVRTENTVSGKDNATYATRFKKRSQSRSKYFCARCKTTISARVATYCFTNKNKFGGRAYCIDCQNEF